MHIPIEIDQICRPTLLIKELIVRRNIARMRNKLPIEIQFRPHFKTHQSRSIGAIYQEMGVRKTTVSSVEMAEYFANSGWTDITIAVPLNIRQLDRVVALAQAISVGILIDSQSTADHLLRHLNGTERITIWLEIDAGYRRTGFRWEDTDAISTCLNALQQDQSSIMVNGILTHSGHSYQLRSKQDIIALHALTMTRMTAVKNAISRPDWCPSISIGDTPSCSLLDSFEGIDEIRPGNFVYYDLTQEQIGSCSQNDIAVAVATPIIGIYPDRSEVVVYGGAVHFSKDSLDTGSEKLYGYLVTPHPMGWERLPMGNRLVRLSQEHGIVSVDSERISSLRVGDLLYIQPVHACLAAQLLHSHTHIF